MRFEPENEEKDYTGNWRQTRILHAGIGEENPVACRGKLKQFVVRILAKVVKLSKKLDILYTV